MINLILDIDNCLLDSRAWFKYLPKDFNNREQWDIYHKYYKMCCTNNYMRNWLKQTLFNNIFFVTSREEVKGMREITEQQIFKALSWWTKETSNLYLYMRNASDYRSPSEVKKDIVLQNIYYKHPIDLAIDDDINNINMYQTLGIKTWHYEHLANSANFNNYDKLSKIKINWNDK